MDIASPRGLGRLSPWRLFRRPKPAINFAEVRRQRFAVNLTDDRILCSVLGRFRVFADANDYDVSPHLIMDGAWEEVVSKVIIDRFRPGMVGVDVGANLGYFTLLMALLCGGDGRIVAFEPNPRAFRLLSDTIALNGLTSCVTLFDTPLAETDGRDVILAVPPNQPGGAQLTTIPGETMIQHHLKTARLDSIAAAHGATLVKIDTEGLEEAVWNGMTAILDSPTLRYVIVEFTRRSYLDPVALLRDAVARGFSIHRIRDEGGTVPTDPERVMDGPLFQMLLFER